MSANLGLVRSIYADWERGDFSSAEWAHPEIEFVIADGTEPGSWTGLAGMNSGFRGPLSAWEDFRAEAEEYPELHDGSVLLLLRAGSGRGKMSGLEIGQMRTKGANLFHIRDGNVTVLVVYLDRDRALADLGLTPDEAGRACMSKRNVELMRRVYDVFNAGDIEAFIAYCDPSIEFHSVFATVFGGVYHEHDGVRTFFCDLAEAWDAVRAEPEAYFDLGEHTLTFILYHGRGGHSGTEVGTPIAQVAKWRNDLIVCLKSYVHREDALSDLGVSQAELEPIEP